MILAADVCRLFIAAEPGEIDEPAIKRALGSVTARSLAEVAELFGVSPQTVRQGWRQGGMPGSRGKWNAAAIALWFLRRRQRNSHRLSASNSSPSDELEMRAMTARVGIREFQLRRQLEHYIDVDQVKSECDVCVDVIRSELATVSDSLSLPCSESASAEMRDEIQRAIDHALTAAEERLNRIGLPVRSP